MEVRDALEILCHIDQRYQHGDVLLGQDELGKSIATARCRVCSAHVVLDLVEVTKVGVWEHDRANVVDIV